ncbi:RICIN domain-containing protein [Streptomyces olivaceoviridis]|uniref:RICIN domain-containing protein n=1 Tax=Streptomyces olivaceoviridis TaxID=1921 RepID=UPI00332CC75A
MEMKHREPQSGRSDESAGAPAGEALWEGELPWALPSPQETAEALGEEAVGSSTTGPATGAATRSAAPAVDPLPAEFGPDSGGGPQRRVRKPGRDTHEPTPLKGHLAKPILTGAGLLSAVFLLTPMVYGLHEPAQTVQAGPQDRDPGQAPEGRPPAITDASSAPRSSDAPNGDRIGKTGGHDRISAVAANAPTRVKEPGETASASQTAKPGVTRKPSAPSPKPSPTTPKPATTTHHSSGSSDTVPGVGIFSHDSGRCIDVVGGDAVRGAALEIWDCLGKASQRWTFPGDGTMRTLGMCVQLAGGSTDDGTPLVLADCNGGRAQQFRLNAAHDLVNSYADKCADVRDMQTANGTHLQLWSCGGTDNQKWSKT